MKKILILCLTAMLVMAGCSKKDDKPEQTTPTPTATPEVVVTPSATPDQGKTEDAGEGEDPEIKEEVKFDGETLDGSYIEEVNNSATTLTFNQDKTFDTNLNICSGMSPLSGVYEIEGDTLTLWFAEETGLAFLDGTKFSFTLEDNAARLALNEGSEMFSCAGVDSYIVRK